MKIVWRSKYERSLAIVLEALSHNCQKSIAKKAKEKSIESE